MKASWFFTESSSIFQNNFRTTTSSTGFFSLHTLPLNLCKSSMFFMLLPNNISFSTFLD
uniref:Uncharacterized protein n=1 Tax=Solanum lycopersicum TaxID=4081 RepID=A0A3Q7EER5_SOLLC